MSFLEGIKKITKNFGKEPTRELESSLLSLFFQSKQENLNGFEQSELLALDYILKGDQKKADAILNITRNIPKKFNSILLLIILARKEEETKKQTPLKVEHKVVPVKHSSYTSNMTFEDFIKARFSDIRLEELTVLSTEEVVQLLQMIVSGIRTNYTTIQNGKIIQHTKVRFEHHTTTSSEELLKRFIEIGESRLLIMKLLKHDSFSYEIRRHLTKFDAYVSTLSDNSPTALLAKIRPFAQVFKWFIKLLSMKSFDEVHNELLFSSQTSFKSDLSIHLWSASFEETARPLYNFAFTTFADEQPKFPLVFNEVADDCNFAGELLRFLRDAAPSHPIIELSQDFMEVFLSLENRLDEYRARCDKIIDKNTNEWIDFHAHQEEILYNEFTRKTEELKNKIREEKMEEIENDRRLRLRKQEELERLKAEAEAYRMEKKRREEEEEESKKRYIEGMMSSKAANPLQRPLTDEEQRLVEKEKIDIFREFQEQMRELGASEEQIMKFFPDINLPEDELEALNGPEQITHEEEENASIQEEEEEHNEEEHIKETMESSGKKIIALSPDLKKEIHEMSISSLIVDSVSSIEEEEEEQREQITNDEDVQIIAQEANTQVEKEFESDVHEEEEEDFIPGPPIQTIPALVHRLVIPSFKLQHEMISKAVFSLIKSRDDFQAQLVAIMKLFLVRPSFEMSDVISEFCAIPYGLDSHIRINKAITKALEKLKFKGTVSFSLFTSPPKTSDEIFQFITNMSVTIKPDQLFSRLLPDSILNEYISAFRMILLLHVSKAAISKQWRLERDSYSYKPDTQAFILMSRFVTATETYIYDSVLTKASFELQKIISCDVIESYLAGHRKTLKVMSDLIFTSKEMTSFRINLANALKEIIKFSFGPLLGEKSISFYPFREKSEIFANQLRQMDATFNGFNENFKFLHILFSDFITTEDDE